MTAVAAPLPPVFEPSSSLAPERARGRPRKTEDERDDGNRRQQLLTAAARLFREKGFDATSTRDIAAAVGMHSGSPIYHFRSTDAMLLAVMEEGMRAAIARQAQALQGAEPGSMATAVAAPAVSEPVEQLRRLIRAH